MNSPDTNKNDFSVFSTISINGLSEQEGIKEVNKFWDLAKNLYRRYQYLNTAVTEIESREESFSLSSAITEFNLGYQDLNNSLIKIAQPNHPSKEFNLNLAVKEIKKFDDLFNQIEPYYKKYKDKIYVDNTLNFLFRHDPNLADTLTQKISTDISMLNNQWINIQTDLTQKIESGIQEITKIGHAKKLSSEFASDINFALWLNRWKAFLYFVSFLLALLIITFVLVSNSIPTLQNKNWMLQFPGDWKQVWLLKFSLVLPLIWVAKWFSNNYSQARLAIVKFSHLKRLALGGVRSIVKLVEDDLDARKEVYKAVGTQFLNIEDLTNTAKKESKLPMGDVELVTQLKNIMRNIS